MAWHQPAGGGRGVESVAEFMKRRRREVERLGDDAEAVGREAWAGATRAGFSLLAARPADVLVLGARILAERDRPSRPPTKDAASASTLVSSQGARNSVTMAPTARAAPASRGQASIPAPAPRKSTAFRGGGQTISFGALDAYVPSPEDLAEFRRQQTEFGARKRDLDRKNAWMAVPALAPAAVVMGLEGAAVITAGLARSLPKPPPLQLTGREPHLRVGDNWATRAGRRAHNQLKDKLRPKEGWDYEPRPETKGPLMKPDAGTPARKPEAPEKRFYIELKPDTPSGRRAAAKAVKRYQEGTKQRARAIYYDPKDFL